MRSRGSVSVELVLLTPVLMVLASFVIHVGRLGDRSVAVGFVAAGAAREASWWDRSDMAARAATYASVALESVASSCGSGITRTEVGDTFVAVEVGCRVDASDLGLLGVGGREVTARSQEVIDVWRAGS